MFPVVVLAEVILPALAASYTLKLCPHVVANCAWGVREDVVADIMVGTVPKAWALVYAVAAFHIC